MVDGVKRRYDSTSRKRQAHENRSRILAAAHKLFVDRGYGSTTVPEIAAAAGVAAVTVYSTFGNKVTLLHRAWDVAVGGDEQAVHLLERPEMRAVFDEPELSQRFLRFAAVNTAIMRRTARLRLAVQGAASTHLERQCGRRGGWGGCRGRGRGSGATGTHLARQRGWCGGWGGNRGGGWGAGGRWHPPCTPTWQARGLGWS